MSSILNTNKPIVDNEFKYLLQDAKLEDERKFIEGLWQKYEPYADAHFPTEITINFHSRFWEMYLACVLMEQGFELIPLKQKKRPDICLRMNNRNFWIEAIAPTAGQGPDAIHKPDIPVGQVHYENIPEEKVILRLQSAIQEKFKRYKAYIDGGIVKVEDTYIIAVNGRRIPYSTLEDDVPYIVKAVLPFGSLDIIVDLHTDEFIGEEYSYRPEIRKAQGDPVSTRVFLEKEFAGISGILYSKSDFLNVPQRLGTEFIFLHNKLAQNPLPLLYR